MIQGAAIAAPVAKGGVSMAASTVPTLLTNSAGIAPGLTASGVFSGLSSIANPFMTGLSVLQGIGAYRTGQYKSAMADIEGERVRVEAATKEVKAIEDANRLRLRLLSMNSTAVANAAAGNVESNSGSAKKLQQINEAYARKDLARLDVLQSSYKTFGDVQSELFALSGDEYQTQGSIGFLSGIGQAMYINNKFGTPGSIGK